MANIRDNGRDFFTYEAITVAGTALSLTRATYEPTTVGQPNAKYALMTVETDQIRVTFDGTTTPTATVGHLLNVGDTIELHGQNNIKNFQAIRVTTSASLRVSYAA